MSKNAIKIAYIVPGVGLSESEVKRREKIANTIAGERARVDIVTVSEGPRTIENSVEEAFAATSYLKLLCSLARQYDAFVVGCFGDPGLRAARELVERPIVGPGESSLHLAAMLADDFIVLTPLRTTIPLTRELVKRYGFAERVKAIVPVEVSVSSIISGDPEVIERLRSTIKSSVERHEAGAVVLGCMSMGFALVDELLEGELDVPIVNPVKVSLKVAELIASLKLKHSKVSYPSPDYSKLKELVAF
uniref:Asp/Glu racemase n=1 Tax=Fervidicoccus fontis TaxID=683846 RepID=A0A7J3ZJE1_9CREN